jgi:hypothetical protein
VGPDNDDSVQEQPPVSPLFAAGALLGSPARLPGSPWLVLLGYGVASILLYHWLNISPSGSKPRRLVLIMVVQYALFLILVRQLWGILPWFVVAIVLAALLLNLRLSRACQNCGEPLFRPGVLSRAAACPSCGGHLVSVWAAARQTPAGQKR